MGGIIGDPIGTVTGNIFGGHKASQLLSAPGIAQLIGGSLGLGGRPDPIRQEVGRLTDVSVQSSAYGTSPPVVLAPWRTAGEIIWATPKKQSATTSTETIGGGKGGLFGGGEQQVITTTYTYSVSIAISFADARDGPIAGIPMLWANGELIYNLTSGAGYESYISSVAKVKAIRNYTGTLTQPVDPLIAAIEGVAPAYISEAYSVFEDLQLETWNNGIPNIEGLIVPAGSYGITTPFLDAAGTFDTPFDATSVNFSIMNDGMLALVMFTASARQYSIRNPFTLEVIQVLPDIGAASTLTVSAVLMNQYGDMFNGPTYKKSGSPSVAVGLDFHTRCFMDLRGRFLVACRYTNSPYRPVVVVIELDGSFRLIDIPTNYGLVDMWYGYDDYVYVSTTDGAASVGPMLKIDLTSGAIVKVSALVSEFRRFVVASDGSVFYTLNNSVEWRRMPATWDSTTLLFSYGLAGGFTQLEGWGRNWETGGAVGGFHSEFRSYAADGTLLESLPTGSAELAYNIITHPNYPTRIYYAQSAPIGGAGNRFVNVVRKALSQQSVTLASAISKICARAGLQPGEYSVSSISDSLGGYAYTQSSARDVLAPLVEAFLLHIVDDGVKLNFVKRGAAPVLTIPQDDLRMLDSEEYSAVLSEDTEESELPMEVSVRYRDVSRNYLADSQYDRRLVTTSKNSITVDYQIGMLPTQARQLAAAMLYDKWMGRRIRRWALDRKYARLLPGDVVALPVQGVLRNVLVTSISDANGIRKCVGRDDESAIFSQVIAGGSGAAQSTTVGSIGPTALQFLDIPLLRDSDDEHGVYLAAAGVIAGWSGAKLFKSSDAGITYADTGTTFIVTSAIGVALSALGNFFGGNIFDELNFVDVSLGSGSMASITSDQAQADFSDILIGNEIVACRSRVLVSANTYRCSGLLRGRYGTDWAMGLHSIGERVVVLSESTIKSQVLASSELSVSRSYKAVSFGALLQLATPVAATYQGERLKPRAPVLFSAGRNAAGDIIGNFTRQARRATSWQNGLDVPLDEPSELYRIRVFSGTALVVTGVTKAINAELTVTGSPLPAAGDWIYLHSIGGMVQLNERTFQVVAVTAANKFTINDDSSNYSIFTSGGSVLKLKPSGAIDVTTPTFTYTGAQQTTDYGALQSSVRASVRMVSSRVGEGRERTAIL